MSNCLDPDQAQHLVRPDLSPYYFQQLNKSSNQKLPIAFILVNKVCDIFSVFH